MTNDFFFYNTCLRHVFICVEKKHFNYRKSKVTNACYTTTKRYKRYKESFLWSLHNIYFKRGQTVHTCQVGGYLFTRWPSLKHFLWPGLLERYNIYWFLISTIAWAVHSDLWGSVFYKRNKILWQLKKTCWQISF